MEAEVAVAFWLVVTARFVLPLFIFRYPLPAIIACLVLDGVDQTIFQSFGLDPPGYQGYDKAMDVFYLAMGYLSTLRNWRSLPALRIARFLYYYRLAGVVAFEFLQWRVLLLIFPNTFEYFFIAYEAIRLRRDPSRYAMRFWVVTAALIWVVVKLPQEYWIHVAQLDFTDTVAEVPWFGPAVVLGLLALLAVMWFVVRPHLPAADWAWRVTADPMPPEIDEAAERAAYRSLRSSFLGTGVLEKVTLIGLISVIYGQVIPELRVTGLQLFLAVAVFVVANAALSTVWARRGRGIDSLSLEFVLLCAVNSGLVWLSSFLLGQAGEVDEVNALFFMMLVSLITVLYDHYRPVYEVRFGTGPRGRAHGIRARPEGAEPAADSAAP